MQIYIGTSGWTYEHWRGGFYPPDLPQSRWFAYYVQHFPVVEINATFYRTFKDQTYLKWYNHTPPDFRFILKAPRLITHRKYLENVAEDIQKFDRSARLLAEKLGLILLQLAPATPYDVPRLRTALQSFQDPTKVAIELRSAKWITDEVLSLLKELGVTYCNPDSPRTPLSSIVTSASLYFRLHGRRRWYAHNYTDEELLDIAQRALQTESQGVENAYILFNNDFEGFAPQNALKLMQLIAQIQGN
ncbi:MAG: DUF72 domain-containing protein [Anaerolineales bacterium]